MKSDLPAAALRLMQSLPVRTHERKPAVAAKPQQNGNRFGRRPVMINGVEYDTIREARNKLGIGYEGFYRMIAQGKARYV